jgi:hypothetical protein
VVVSTHLPHRAIPHAGGRFSFAWLSELTRFGDGLAVNEARSARRSGGVGLT